MLGVEEFFSLSTWAHRALWVSGAPVWAALHTLKSYLSALSHRIEIEIPPGVCLENADQISIGKGTVLEPGVFIRGPCLIGENCSIRHGAYLRGGTLLGRGCAVGHCVEIKGSILLDGACASHLCYVGDSILGSGVNLGAGVKCANLRLDRKEIVIHHGEERIGTRLKKMGAILGDGVQIGCNCVLNPGTLVGRETRSDPLLSLRGVIAPKSRIQGKTLWTVEPVAEKILEQLLR